MNSASMTRTYFAPGRINLIGEHLDYNGGPVLPAALTIGITARYTPRSDNKIVLHSSTHQLHKEFDLSDPIEYSVANDWINYPLGVIAQLKKEGHFITPCQIEFESNLPEQSGLSSSAAIEVLTGYLLLNQTEGHIDLPWLANFCKQVENEFIGLQCGIMDQFAVALGKAGNAILLNCSNLDYSYIPFQLNNYRLLILNSKKPRNLVQSKYNERKSQCEEALRILQATSSIQHLAEATFAQLDLIQDEVIKKRARHVVTETLRVKESVKALRFNDLSTFGRLMNASHASLKNDYEVTGFEMDTLAREAQQLRGCLGARITGGGFGGCCIALVHQETIAEFKNFLSFKYHAATGLNCEIYESEIGNGVEEKIINSK